MMVSVVVPVFGCNATLEELVTRVSAVFSSDSQKLEILLVDDGNPPDTWKIIQNSVKKHSYVRGLRLSRNFGQHPTIMAGLRAARGDVLIVLDCDLQDPIDELPRFVASLAESDVAVSLRVRSGHSRLRAIQSRMYASLLKMATGTFIDTRAGGIVAMTRKVADCYIQFREPDHHMLYILSWLGFKTSYLETTRVTRAAGDSSYNLRSRVKHSMRGALFHTSRLVLGVASLGALMTFLGLGALAFALVRAIADQPAPGWLSTISASVILMGFNLIVTSVIALYVTRTFEIAKNRPLFVVADEI